jgi:hypothetical protein
MENDVKDLNRRDLKMIKRVKKRRLCQLYYTKVLAIHTANTFYFSFDGMPLKGYI